MQATAAAVCVELDGDGGSDMDQLLSRISSEASDGRYGAAVAVPRAIIDPVDSVVGRDVGIVIDGDDAERAAALAIALSRTSLKQSVADVASDQSAERLRQLSDEVSR